MSGGEDEQDLNSFSHIFESETSTLPHFSTPINKPSNEDVASVQQKRPIKVSQNSVTSKRVKPSENSGQSLKMKSPSGIESDMIQEDEETDYIEAPHSIKMESMEPEESKQFLESNGNGNIIETNHQDQGRLSLENVCMHSNILMWYVVLLIKLWKW